MSIANLRKDLKEKEAIFGTDRTIKGLKTGKIEAIYLSGNCPSKVKEDIEYYAKLSKAKVYELKENNEELALICKKPFFVSVIGFKK